MNAVALISSASPATSDNRLAQGARAAGLPDFAALLGTALAFDDHGQKLARQPAAAAATSALTAASALSAAESFDPTAGRGLDAIRSRSKTDGLVTTDDAGQAVNAIQGLNPRAAASPADGTSETTNEGETADSTANAAALALATTPASATPAASAPAASRPIVIGSGARHTAKSATTSKTLIPEAKAQDVKSWNVRELSHQLKAALGSASGTLQQAEDAKITGKPMLAASFLTQVDGDKIRSEGTQNLLRTMPDGNGKSASAAEALLQAAAGPGVKPTAQQILDSAGSVLESEPVLAAAARLSDEADSDETALPPTAATTTAPRVWTATPGTDETGETRMPNLAEQVCQVADYLAERTEGVVRVSQEGMEANLRLYPPDLGGVRVQLTVASDGTAQAQFIVERAETAQLLQQHMRSFQQGMESHGLKVDGVQVTVQSTVRPTSSSAESGWRQGNTQEFRRDGTLDGEQSGQNSRRNNRERQDFTQD